MNASVKKPISKWCARFITCSFSIVALTVVFILHQDFLVYTSTSSKSDILKHDSNYNELTQFVQKLEDSMGHAEGAYEENYRDKEFEESFKKYKVSSLKMQEPKFESTIIELRASQYRNLKLLLNGRMNHGEHVCISKTSDTYSTSHSLYRDSIIVNVTVYSNGHELLSEIQTFGCESKDGFLVQVDHDKKWFRFPRKSKQEDHLSYGVDITFPYWLTDYESLEIKAENAKCIEGVEGLEDIQFDFFKIGLGQGTLIFNKLNAGDIQLTVLRGMILGTYRPKNNFMSASLQGANKVHIDPTSEKFNITANFFGRTSN
ncbi:unnamed protein product [Rhizopus stolonifer]